jgi:cytoskeletal protein RodZ
MIQDMRQTTAVTEDSFRSLLAAVDTFCSQATRQLERLSVPAQLAEPPRSALPSRSWGTAIAVGIVVLGILSASYVLWPSKTPGTVSAKQPVTVNAASLGEQPKTAHELLKPNATAPVGQPKTAREQLASNGAALVEQSKPTAHEPVAPAIPETPKPGVMTVHLEASEPAWVSVTDGGGTKLFSKVLQAGESQNLGLTQTATLRTGNAGGLAVQLNGQPIGTLGPQGKVREILFQDGTYKVLGSAR